MISIKLTKEKTDYIKQLAELYYKTTNINNTSPENFSSENIINMLKQEGYIKGYKDALTFVLNDVYDNLGKAKTVKLLKKYIVI